MNSAPTNCCPDCGAPLAGGDVPAYCPACLWGDLTREDQQGGAAGPGVLFTVAGHEVLAEIARGGGGVVYRARQREPRREVALKMLLPAESASEERQARFRIETDAIAGLGHRAILPVYVVGEHRGMPFFTMKLATGGTLTARCATLRRDWRAIAGLMLTLADAVQYAHTHGVIHRDLKPGNVLFDETGQPFVSDFGLAKFLDPDVRVTRTLAYFGTPAYLAPEVAEHGGGAATTATDVYGLGAILYELLCGRPPFAAESLPALLRQIVEIPPPPARNFEPTVPADLEVIARRCLAKDPAQRFGSAAEFADDLRRWLDGRPILSRPAGPAERLGRWARRNPALALVSTLLVVSLVAGGAGLISRNLDLKRSNARVVAAAAAERTQLQANLISEARLTRRTGLVGQRAAALTLLDRAAELGPLDSLRSEYIATLVRSDLTIEQRMGESSATSDFTVDFSPDLARLLDVDAGGVAVEREVVSREVRRKFPTRAGRTVWYLGYAPDGTTVSVSYRDGGVEVWTAGGDAPAWSVAGLYGADAQPRPFALHPDGNSVACVAADDSVEAFQLHARDERPMLPARGEIRLLSFNPDGTILLAVYRDRVTAWSWPEGKPLWSYAGTMSPARPAWSNDGRRVAVGLTGRDDIAMLDAASGALERLFSVHIDDGRLLAFQPGGRLLASVGWDGRLVLLDAFSGETVLQREAWVRTLRFSADGRKLAFSSSHVEVVAAALAQVDCLREVGEELTQETASCRLAVSPDGRWLASTDFNELRLWDVARGQLVARKINPTKEWSVVTFTRQGDALIQSRRFSGLFRWPLVGAGADVTLGAPEPVGPPGPADLMRIEPDSGDWWILRFPTGQIVRWPGGRPDAEREVLKMPGIDGAVPSADGRYLLRRDFPREGVEVLDASNARTIARLPAGVVLSANFTPDGKGIVTGTNREYRVWKTGTWESALAWPAEIAGGSYGRTSFSPDGRLIAALQKRGTLELRDAQNDYRAILVLELPQDWWVHHFEWSPDGTRIYVLSQGHRMMYWDLGAIRRELASRGMTW